jgi:DNA-binding transcriptional MerR regulator
MKLILRGKRIGFSLDEIKQFLDLYDADPTQVEQLKLLRDGVEQRISQLIQQKKDISQTLSELKAIQLATNEALVQKRQLIKELL